MNAVLAKPPHQGWAKILKISLPTSIILVAISAFLLVNYQDDGGGRSYREIASEGAYLISKSVQQLTDALGAIENTIGVWTVLVLLVLIAIRGHTPATGAPDRDARDASKRLSGHP